MGLIAINASILLVQAIVYLRFAKQVAYFELLRDSILESEPPVCGGRCNQPTNERTS